MTPLPPFSHRCGGREGASEGWLRFVDGCGSLNVARNGRWPRDMIQMNQREGGRLGSWHAWTTPFRTNCRLAVRMAWFPRTKLPVN